MLQQGQENMWVQIMVRSTAALRLNKTKDIILVPNQEKQLIAPEHPLGLREIQLSKVSEWLPDLLKLIPGSRFNVRVVHQARKEPPLHKEPQDRAEASLLPQDEKLSVQEEIKIRT